MDRIRLPPGICHRSFDGKSLPGREEFHVLFHHGVFMILRLATANENHWEREGTEISQSSPAATKSLTAETRSSRRSFLRAHDSSVPGCLTPCTLEACAHRKTRKKFFP